MSADQIMEQIQDRSDALRDAELRAAETEMALKAWEATTALAFRSSGMSMSEAERRVRAQNGWDEIYMACQEAQIDAAEAKRKWSRACQALEAWRTERATMRAAG